MPTNYPSLEEKEDDDPHMALLWEWWVTATQALVDTVGSKLALKALLPYYINANTAANHILKEYFKDIAKEPDYFLKMFHFSINSWLGGRTIVRAGEDRAEAEVFGCKTRGECKELCQLVSKEVPENAMKTFGLKPSLIFMKSLSYGDDHCHIVINYNDVRSRSISSTLREIEPPDVSKEVLMSFRLQYVAESWVFSTRAFLDCVGSQTTLEKLRMYMRHSGLAFGMNVVETSNVKNKEASFLGKIIGEINDSHMRKGERRDSMDYIEEEVRECPFAQAPPEVCLQYEAFFRGVCEAINPEYEFSYDRMMSTGDKTCHWTIGRKGAERIEESRENKISEEPLRLLATRLAKGEITDEEFDKKMALLRKHGLVQD